jgi:hypothetical protein
MRFGYQARGRGFAVQQFGDDRVRRRFPVGTPGRTEARKLGVLQTELAGTPEELDVLGVAAGPAALDVIDA